jgi:hypothetical protein
MGTTGVALLGLRYGAAVRRAGTTVATCQRSAVWAIRVNRQEYVDRATGVVSDVHLAAVEVRLGPVCRKLDACAASRS